MVNQELVKEREQTVNKQLTIIDKQISECNVQLESLRRVRAQVYNELMRVRGN